MAMRYFARRKTAAFDATMKQAEHWSEWRQGVICTIRAQFNDVLDHISEDDVDWDAWRPLYDEGRSPKAAVDRAFLRDF
jgi:hypothetical protein